MAEDINQLIEKIQQEGIQAAEEKAKEIQSQAKKDAGQIIEKAKNEAQIIILEAEDKIKRLEEASKTSLSQAGRNLLISLRKEINDSLGKVLILTVRQSLQAQELSKILHSLISESVKQNKSSIVISVSKEDSEKLEKTFLSGLKEEIKKGITLKGSEDISAGFLISYDAGKSHFDFTDEALADYIRGYLKPELAKLLKE